MKVNHKNDSVELSSLGRSRRSDKAAAARQKQAAESAGEVGSSGSTGAAAGVEISEEAKALSNANQIARADTTDQAKIDRIKAMIHGGSYKPDFGKVADKMINETLLQDAT